MTCDAQTSSLGDQLHGKDALEKAKGIMLNEYNGVDGTKVLKRDVRRADINALIEAGENADIVKEALANDANASQDLERCARHLLVL